MDVPPDDIQSWLAAQAAGKTGRTPPRQVDPDPALVPDAADEVAAGIPTTVTPSPSAIRRDRQ